MAYGFYKDIVAALEAEARSSDHRGAGGLCRDAAAEIERLRAVVTELIEAETDAARTHYAQYDRQARRYDFNDEIWRSAHEHSFNLVQRARALVALEQKASHDA